MKKDEIINPETILIPHKNNGEHEYVIRRHHVSHGINDGIFNSYLVMMNCHQRGIRINQDDIPFEVFVKWLAGNENS